MKVFTTHILMEKQMKTPVITGIYDPISKRRDGTISSQGLVVISGKNLAMLDLQTIRLYLIPTIDSNHPIEIPHIYYYSQPRVIISLPMLSPGEYFPAVKTLKEGEEESLYVFPVSWVVLPESYVRERFCLKGLVHVHAGNE